MHTTDSTIADQRDLLNWARDTVGIAAELDTQHVRTELLRHLTAHDFVPPEEWHDAIRVLATTSVPATQPAPMHYLRARESELRPEVEQFAKTFFELDIKARGERWKQLAAQCAAIAPLRIWLNRLEAGLDVECRWDAQQPASIQEFGDLVCQAFLQLRGPAAHEFRQKLAQMRRDAGHWQPVARDFGLRYPEVAQLCPRLVSEFAHFFRTRRRMAISKCLNTAVSEWIPLTSDTPLSFRHSVFFILVGVAITAATIYLDDSHKNRSRPSWMPPPPIKSYQLPDFQLTAEEYRRIQSTNPDQLKAAEAATKILIDSGVLKLERLIDDPSQQSTPEAAMKKLIDNERLKLERYRKDASKQLTPGEALRILIKRGVLKPEELRNDPAKSSPAAPEAPPLPVPDTESPKPALPLNSSSPDPQADVPENE